MPSECPKLCSYSYALKSLPLAGRSGTPFKKGENIIYLFTQHFNFTQPFCRQGIIFF
jgi:hypothetical protein